MGPFNRFKPKEQPDIDILQETERLLSTNKDLSRQEALDIAAHRAARVWRIKTIANMQQDNPDLSMGEICTVLMERLENADVHKEGAFIAQVMGLMFKEHGSIERCKNTKQRVAYRKRLLTIAYRIKTKQ